MRMSKIKVERAGQGLFKPIKLKPKAKNQSNMC